MLLFYDAPEYLNIVVNNNFLTAIKLGHTPIHPVFIALLWLHSKILPIHLFSLIWGIIGSLSVYLISKEIKIKYRFFPVFIYLTFPTTWILLTNLMVESLALPLFNLSLLFLIRNIKKNNSLKYYVIITALMIGTHIQALFWIPAQLIFLNYSLPKKKINLIHFLRILIPAVALGIMIYLLVFILSNKNIPESFLKLFFFRANDQFEAINLLGVLRMIRNVIFTLFSGLSIVAILILAILSAQNIYKRKNILAWVLFWISVLITGSVWTGDFMPRRIAYLAPIIALILVRKYELKSTLLLVYLLPIFLANYFLYLNPQFYVFEKINKLHKNIPTNSMLVQTHYLRPFTSYPNTIWLGQDDLSEIDSLLNEGKRVFVDSQALLAPYYLYTGNNLHITSLKPKGEYDSKPILEKYKLQIFSVDDVSQRLFLTEIVDIAGNGSELKFKYSDKLSESLLRARVNYADAALWLWVIITNYREPIAVSLISS